MKRILNLGCGNDLYGTHRLDMYKTPATTEVSDLNKKFPYPSNYFDEIYCKSVLEHIRNLGNFVNECYRVLRPGGRIFIRTDYAGNIMAHLSDRHEPNKAIDDQYKAGGFGHGQQEDHHYTLFVTSHLKHLFGKFRNHRFRYVYLGGSSKIKRFIAKMLPRNMGACHIEMEAYK